MIEFVQALVTESITCKLFRSFGQPISSISYVHKIDLHINKTNSRVNKMNKTNVNCSQ